ncbi:universal stress protein [Haloterrigena sp. H1]|uniref:universal stress protein n=1 Tax=Haloterrigena sp. H1 TaxID=2552943 RepID=UPI00110E2FAE|nr:universal stress protein [Haloterrigena sp. H1]TMT87681.1 universal stress protein [Haloterrigena sp. H1]
MYTQILFPTDGSEGSAAAFDHVLEIADSHDSTVHILNVADTTQDSVLRRQGEVVDTLVQEGETIVDDADDRAQQRGIETVTEVRKGVPYSTIVDYAASHDVDLVVMPTHGRQGLRRFLLGSTTERVIRQAETPMLTIRPDTDTIDYPYRNVLVPTDGSESAQDALAIGTDIATTEGAALHLLSVVTTATLGVDVRNEIQLSMLEESATKILDDASAFATETGVEPAAETIEFGSSIPQTIRTYVDEHDIDLVVVGTHGRTGFDRYLLGSVTEQLVRTSPVPVLTVWGERGDT